MITVKKAADGKLKQHYSNGRNQIFSDEPEVNGGDDDGLGPPRHPCSRGFPRAPWVWGISCGGGTWFPGSEVRLPGAESSSSGGARPASSPPLTSGSSEKI